MKDDGKVHISRLKLFGRSPAHYKGAVDRDEYYLERGTASHALLLGGDRVIPYPGAVRRGAQWEAFEAANPNTTILTKGEFAKVEDIAAAVRRDPMASDLLGLGRDDVRHEATIEWSYLGRPCSSRLDVLGRDRIVELKVVADASPQRFMWQCVRMGWFAQLDFYNHAATSRGGGGLPAAHRLGERDLYIVAVESAPPHVPACYRLDESAIEHGRKSWRLWFERLLQCEEAKHFPGYCESIMRLSAPDEEDAGLVFPDPEPTEEAA